MATNYAKHFNVAKTPQSEPIPGKAMAENAAGGYAFAVDDWRRLRRFLVLGTEGGTYYASEREITMDNAACLLRCIAEDGPRAVATIASVSRAGLAPKNDAAVFALAVASVKGDDATRRHALAALPEVCRTGTHLFQFAAAREAAGGGWGRATKRAVGAWYDREDLVLQLLKYQQRDGWSHRDLLRLAHPDPMILARRVGGEDIDVQVAVAEVYGAAFDAACAPDGGTRWGPTRKVEPGSPESMAAHPLMGTVTSLRHSRGEGRGWAGVDHPLAAGYTKAKELAAELGDVLSSHKNGERMARIVADHRLPRELVPTEYLSLPEVQEAMLPHLGLTALVRNLGNMSKSGLLKPLGMTARGAKVQQPPAVKVVCDRLTDAEAIARSRVHPFQLLLASKTYGQGRGHLGKGEWVVVPEVVDALDEAFRLSFGNVVPTGKRHLIGIDVSGSMSSAVQGTAVTCSQAAGAMAMATAWAEPACYAFGFNTRFEDLGITRKTTLQALLKKIENKTYGGTDCAVAIKHAIDNAIDVDAFVVYTDSETWAGDEHACQAIRRYRKASGIDAKLAVVGFTATGHTIGDDADPGSMDFVGLDASLPQALAAFVGEGA